MIRLKLKIIIEYIINIKYNILNLNKIVSKSTILILFLFKNEIKFH